MERMLRAEKLQLHKPAKRGWLLITDQRLVFADEDRIGSREHWSIPLHWVESAVAGESFSYGTHKFVIHYRDDRGVQQKQEFDHINFSKGILLGPLSKIGGNPLSALEQAVNDHVSRAVSASSNSAESRGAADVTSELERLAGLMASGALTGEEFAAAKAKVLGDARPAGSSQVLGELSGAGPFRVELLDAGKDQSGVTQVLMQLHKETSLDSVGPFHAGRIIAGVPVALEPVVSLADALTARRKLEAKGATVRVTDVSTRR